jgi:hypothetical protein
VQYHLLAAMGQTDRKQPEPRVMRIFDRGNLYEDRAREWLKRSGFVFSSQEHKFSDFDRRFRGHVDGVLVGWEWTVAQNICPISLPALWENKCLGAKNWKKLSTNKLKNYSPTYYAQVQIYMHYLRLPRCLFTAVNADTMEIYHELIEYDPMEAELYRSRVQQVIAATDEGRMMERISNDRNFYICKWCDFHEECWS